MTAETRSSSRGYSCSARSYLREMGRITSSANPRACSMRGIILRGTSRSIMVGCSLPVACWDGRAEAYAGRPAYGRRSREEGALEQAGAAQVAEPPLVVELLDEAVAAEHLDGARADPGTVPGSEGAGVGDERGGVQAVVEPGRRLPGDEPQGVQLDGDVGDGERDGLTAADGLPERLALLDVRDELVEDRLRRAAGHGRPREPSTTHGIEVILSVTKEIRQRDHDVPHHDATSPRRPQPHGRVVLDGDARRGGLHDDQPRNPVDQGRDDEQLGRLGAGHERLDAVEHEVAAASRADRPRSQWVEERLRLHQG